MMISLAAAPADFTKFEWFSATQPFKLELDAKHPLQVAEDDLIGLNKATRGPTSGKYQVVLAKYPQLIFRSIDPAKVAKFEKKLKTYAGVPEKPKKTGQRQTRLVRSHIGRDDKLSAQFFKAPSKPTEHSGYDKDDYQWRKLIRPMTITTRHLGKSRATLQVGEVIGLRYLRKSHGGYIIMPNEERIMIDHELYEKITLDSDILPAAQQLKGLVAWDELAAKLPKARVRPKKYKVPMTPPVGGTESSSPSMTDQINKPLVSEFDYEDVDFEFDDDEELDEPEFEEDDDTVNTPEDDHEDDIAFDDDGEEVETGVMAQEGLTLVSKGGIEWVIVAIEEAGMKDDLLLYNEEREEVRHYGVPAGEDLSTLKHVTVGKTVRGQKLQRMIKAAAEIDPKVGTRM